MTHFHRANSLDACKLIALLCVQENAKDMPSMLEVSSMLKNETAALTTLKKKSQVS
jgi:hypothetical protein